MAEVMARTIGAGRIVAYSAGLAPTGRIAAATLSTLARMGYPVDGLSSKGIEQVPLATIDVVVSLIGAQGLRALPPGLDARRESWSVRDPYGDDDRVYQAVARTLELQVRRLVEQLLAPEVMVPQPSP